MNVDLLAMVEQLRKIQSQCNAYERGGYNPLAYTDNAWGDLDKAIKHVLTQHYMTDGHTSRVARAMAERVLEEVYDNKEDIAYNMRLLAKGEIEVPPEA